MDQNEIAQRLTDLRERIRAELEAETPQCLSAGLADSGPAALPAFESSPIPDEPQVYTTAHLQAANDLAVITGPIKVRSQVPVVGSVLTLLRWLARPFVQPFLDPYLARQERFNAEVVRHLNEHGVKIETRLAAIYGALYERLPDSRQVESRLDAALAEYDETLRQRHVVLFDALEEELWAVRAHIAESWQESASSLREFEARFVHRAQAVDARFDAKDEAAAELAGELVGEIDAARTELASEISATRAEVVETLETRALLAETLAVARRSAPPAAAGGGPESTSTPFDAPLWSRLREWMCDQDYRAHQSTFRGAEEEIAERLAAHVERFTGAPGPVADLGCGRGEFLALLSDAGIDAVGVEINDADVQECVARGYEAVHADLFDWLNARELESLGGIFLAQVIEHLPPPQWHDLVRLAASRVAPGGRLLVETINPESLFAMSRAYVIDPTHIRPVHPKLLSFLARRAGFEEIEVHYQAEVSPNERLLPIDEPVAGDDPLLANVFGQINNRLQRIDRICCSPQEYVLLATRRLS